MKYIMWAMDIHGNEWSKEVDVEVHCKHQLIKIGQLDFHIYRDYCGLCKTVFIHNMETGEIKPE